jgi:hypothetical protein
MHMCRQEDDSMHLLVPVQIGHAPWHIRTAYSGNRTDIVLSGGRSTSASRPGLSAVAAPLTIERFLH